MKYLFVTVLKAGKSKINMLADSMSGEDLLPRAEVPVSLLCPYIAGGVGELCGTLIPFRRAPASGLNYLPKTPPPNTITLGLRVSTDEF